MTGVTNWDSGIFYAVRQIGYRIEKGYHCWYPKEPRIHDIRRLFRRAPMERSREPEEIDRLNTVPKTDQFLMNQIVAKSTLADLFENGTGQKKFPGRAHPG